MPQSTQWFMDVVDRVFVGLWSRTESTFNRFLEETGGLEGQDIAFMEVAYGFAPEPMTPDHFIRRSPYRNPDAFRRTLDEAAGRGWFEAAGEGGYQLTVKGRGVVEGLWATADEAFGSLDSLPEADLTHLAALLLKVVTQARELTAPTVKWALLWASKTDRGTAMPLLAQVRRRLIDLTAFRDDAHIAAWQTHGISGHAWEAFSFVWRGDAHSAVELVEKLPHRNYDEAAYGSALRDLVSRGWITKENNQYVVTEKGKQVRQDAEVATDGYFDAAWMVLDESEVDAVKSLLERLAEVLDPPKSDTLDG